MSVPRSLPWLLLVACCAGRPARVRSQAAPGPLLALRAGRQTWEFTRDDAGTWAFARVALAGRPLAVPVSTEDSFFAGSGRATGCTVERGGQAGAWHATFRLRSGSVSYWFDPTDRLPAVHVRIEGAPGATVEYRSPESGPGEYGAWVTRGATAADAEGQEAFIDGSGPVVFGHSRAGGTDTAYVLLPRVNRNVQKNGRTEQRSDTYFGTRQEQDGRGGTFVVWRLRVGRSEPTEYVVLFDDNPMGRLWSVCDRYYPAVVDTLVDMDRLRAASAAYDPGHAVQLMPLRLSAPDAFIPGYGWTMEEYPNAAYPFGHDSCVQTGNLLVYEGLATGRAWERGFGKYVLDHSPLLGADGSAYFARRPGGITRWGYTSDYAHPFPRMDGGNWGDALALYTTAKVTGDARLKQTALEMMKHDVNVKLDLDHMTFPPCWNVLTGAPGDHRDDWATTACLAYCAEACTEALYPETHDRAYIEKADRICDFLVSRLGHESRMNYVHDGVNLYNCWGGWIPLALFHAQERGRGVEYAEVAQDLSWVWIMTLGLTRDTDPGGQPLAGVTCVGVRGCVDYDCAPNLCQEKDLVFDNLIGALLDYERGSAIARYIALQRSALPRDRWNDAFGVQELRGLDLRTMYDTWARGTANLMFALDQCADPAVVALETLVSKRDPRIHHARDVVLANPTAQARKTALRVRWLAPGSYTVRVDGRDAGRRTDAELEAGIPVRVPASATLRVEVAAISQRPQPPAPATFDNRVIYLDQMAEAGAQRGVGLPAPTFVRGRSFGGHALRLGGKSYEHGLGCAANTVIVYDLGRRFRAFRATVGLDGDVAAERDPPASVRFTVFVDGACRFDSGPVRAATPPKPVDVDVRGARTLVLRMSDNWDNGGNSRNDHGDWADARLVGQAAEPPHARR